MEKNLNRHWADTVCNILHSGDLSVDSADKIHWLVNLFQSIGTRCSVINLSKKEGEKK